MRKRKCSMCDCKDICVISPLTCDKEFIILEQKELSKHDSDLLDKVLEKIKDYSYEMYSDISPYPETVVELRDIDSIIAELKAEEVR